MVLAPRTILPEPLPPVDITARRMGRIPDDEIIARRPVGRLVLWFQDRMETGAVTVMRFRTVHDREQLLDRHCDGLATGVLRRSRSTADQCPSCAINVIDCQDWMRTDAQRDSEDAAGRALVLDSIGELIRGVLSQIDRWCTDIVARVRGEGAGR